MVGSSTGCLTCKARRIKCDETRPVCQRCIISRRICRGMTLGRPPSPLFHIENAYASREKKRPRGPRSSTQASDAMVARLSGLETVPQRLFFDLKTIATTYYLHEHLQRLEDYPDILKAVSDDVLARLTATTSSPGIDLGVSSLALATFSKVQRHPPAAIEGSRSYNELLRGAQSTILSLDANNIETCLIEIFFMARYEDAIFASTKTNPSVVSCKSFAHHDGATAVLKIWKDQFSKEHPATDVIRHSRRGIIRSSILRHSVLPNWFMDGSTFGEEGLALEYDRIAVRTSVLRRRVWEFCEENSAGCDSSPWYNATIEELNKESRDLDNDLKAWTQHFPDTYSYQQHDIQKTYSWPMEHFYSPVVYSYSSPSYAALWNQYFSMRMLINSTRHKILNLSPLLTHDFIQTQQADCLSNLNTMADHLIASVPFCFERFRVRASTNPKAGGHNFTLTLCKNEDPEPYIASLLAWPLGIASSIGAVDVKRRRWLKQEVARVGKLTGAGVIEAAESEEWLRF